MLTELGGGHSDGGRGLAELDRIGDDLNTAVGRVVKGDKSIVGSSLGVIDDLYQSLYRGKGYAFQAGLPLFQRSGEKDFIQDMQQGRPVLESGIIGLKSWVVLQVSPLDGLAEPRPVAVRL